MKKQICMVGALLTTLITLITLMPVPAIASPQYAPLSRVMTIEIANLPRNAVFADILIRINERDPNFTAVNEGNLALFGLDAHAEIVGFNDNGFRSFTFHYRDAVAEIRAVEIRFLDGTLWGHNVHFGDRERGAEERGQLLYLLENYPSMKIALLDHFGNVLSVSSAFSLPSPRRGMRILGSWSEEVRYNHETGAIIVNLRQIRYDYLASLQPPLFVTGALVLFFIILELIVGLCFGFRGRNLIFIVPTSLVTLFFITVLLLSIYIVFFSAVFVFFLIMILLIAATYRVKFTIYHDSPAMKDISPRKILLHATTANAVSLVFLAGLFLIISWR